MRYNRYFLSLFALTALCWSQFGHCRKGEVSEVSPEVEETKGPWFTGPLLTGSSHVVPLGYFNLEPYLFVFDFNGSYDKEWEAHSSPTFIEVNPVFLFQVGLTKDLDFTMAPQFFYQRTQGQAATRFGDLGLGLDYQLLWDKPGKWWPAIKLVAREVFPTGKYQHLSPRKKGTDEGGLGSFETDLGLVFGRLFHLWGNHYLSTRLSTTYGIPANVHVEGFNSFGGGFGTRGTVRVGNTISTLFAFEFNMSLNWALALDVNYVYGNKTSFSGKRGFNPDGTKASVGGPSFNQVSLAPAIEYNFNESWGIIAGSWFTVAGRNSNRFVSGVIAVNWFAPFSSQKK